MTIVERGSDTRRVLLRVKSREVGGSGYANADVTMRLENGGGSVHTAAEITGKAPSYDCGAN